MFLKLLSEKDWVIFEDKINEQKIRFQETLFTIGNGYLGLRGILEEGSRQNYAGTYIAGVYDHKEGQPAELVNAPNPIGVEINVDGKRLSPDNMAVIEHRRILDLKKAALSRKTVFKDPDTGKRYEYESRRFFSLKDIHTGAMAFSFRPLDGNVRVVFKHIIDGTTKNLVQAIGDPVKHYAVNWAAASGSKNRNKDRVIYLEAKTIESRISLGFAAAGEVKGAGLETGVKWEYKLGQEFIEQECSFMAQKGKRYNFEVYLSIYTSREQRQGLKKACLDGARTAKKLGIAQLFKAHVRAWDKRWQYSDVKIEGEDSWQKILRFNLYHLLIAAPPKDIDTSIAAKTLTGEWYKGHIFWDTEVFILPFFIFTQPEIARNLLLYRYRRLEQAREGAGAQGYKGTLWPWESAAGGRDETPQTWVNFDGTIIPVYNSTREHHIAGDVIYGISLYHRATSDEAFMLQYGAEMVFEAARFWVSRVTYNSEKDSYEIKKVIGPNEFQECVNNNSYTNALARWTLKYAVELYSHFQNNHPRKLKVIIKKIGLKPEEVTDWKEIADKIVFLILTNGLIEEFEGYFQKREVTIRKWDNNGLPVWPDEVSLAEAKNTQLIKQADVILLLQLFSNEFSTSIKEINYKYYALRTTHKSSLSLSSYAIVALELGEAERADKYFKQAVKTDFSDIYGNTELGVHAAALGGVWQIIGYGFAGIKIKDGILKLRPALPENWKRLNFRLWFKQALIEFDISRNVAEAFIVKDKILRRKGIELEIYDQKHTLYSGEKITVEER
jgi:kojibiose phosphorylase